MKAILEEAGADILWRCDTVRIGMADPDGPYMVPVSFGMEVVADKVAFYFHCARKGLKFDLLAADNRACVEGAGLEIPCGGHAGGIGGRCNDRQSPPRYLFQLRAGKR